MNAMGNTPHHPVPPTVGGWMPNDEYDCTVRPRTVSLELRVDRYATGRGVARALRGVGTSFAVSAEQLEVGETGKVVDEDGDLVASWVILDGDLVGEV